MNCSGPFFFLDTLYIAITKFVKFGNHVPAVGILRMLNVGRNWTQNSIGLFHFLASVTNQSLAIMLMQIRLYL